MVRQLLTSRIPIAIGTGQALKGNKSENARIYKLCELRFQSNKVIRLIYGIYTFY